MAESDDREVIVSVQSVSKVYRMGEVDVHALRDASIDVYDGEFLIIVGPSGSGKSTLLNMIGGMDRPTSGTVRFLDRDLT
ncbi:MAG: ATP-binding cassette domain-containing protein, partial [Planctomycetota bacterium]